MRGLNVLAAAAVLFCSCSPQTLYNWGGSSSSGVSQYENLAYSYSDKQTPEATCKLVVLYEEMTSSPGGLRNMPPPGICAEYGYLLSLSETLQTFSERATSSQMRVFKGKDLSSYFPERSKEMFELELKYYPESAAFIGPLAKRISER